MPLYAPLVNLGVREGSTLPATLDPPPVLSKGGVEQIPFFARSCKALSLSIFRDQERLFAPALDFGVDDHRVPVFGTVPADLVFAVDRVDLRRAPRSGEVDQVYVLVSWPDVLELPRGAVKLDGSSTSSRLPPRVRPSRPSPSKTSRTAASSGSSFRSMCPPGGSHNPSLRWRCTYSPSHTTKTATVKCLSILPILGPFQESRSLYSDRSVRAGQTRSPMSSMFIADSSPTGNVVGTHVKVRCSSRNIRRESCPGFRQLRDARSLHTRKHKRWGFQDRQVQHRAYVTEYSRVDSNQRTLTGR